MSADGSKMTKKLKYSTTKAILVKKIYMKKV